jgi:hypothetical protein
MPKRVRQVHFGHDSEMQQDENSKNSCDTEEREDLDYVGDCSGDDDTSSMASQDDEEGLLDEELIVYEDEVSAIIGDAGIDPNRFFFKVDEDKDMGAARDERKLSQ